ncbi:hypothetical protein HELRODRAFT_98458 [Helobdella robusta]|uniref:Ricin B lectin domain-containing protein n=1 Tax=Helobdella robusta TaxID=6412 RepID=T1G9M9_HELRO|nr:hypothetical protein HELRODRAFT_98458 [Helobdella robusta]ESO07743.1 hypothetical protein HELRODRAFT_98458 [Helobdella robusta]
MLPTEGKFFLLVNNECNLSVGIKNNRDDPATPVVLCNQDDKQEHQIWFEDPATGTIRSFANNYCLTFTEVGKFAEISEYVPDSQTQQWKIGNGYVVHRSDPNKVLDANVPLNCGTKLCVSKNDGSNKWKAVYLKPKVFYILSQLNKKAVEVYQSNEEPGAKIIMWSQKPKNENPTNQLWYEDKQGNVRSALNNFVFDASVPGDVTMQPYEETNVKKHWIIYGHVICNRHNKKLVLDITNSDSDDAAPVGVWEYNGAKNQAWWIHFIN